MIRRRQWWWTIILVCVQSDQNITLASTQMLPIDSQHWSILQSLVLCQRWTTLTSRWAYLGSIEKVNIRLTYRPQILIKSFMLEAAFDFSPLFREQKSCHLRPSKVCRWRLKMTFFGVFSTLEEYSILKKLHVFNVFILKVSTGSPLLYSFWLAVGMVGIHSSKLISLLLPVYSSWVKKERNACGIYYISTSTSTFLFLLSLSLCYLWLNPRSAFIQFFFSYMPHFPLSFPYLNLLWHTLPCNQITGDPRLRHNEDMRCVWLFSYTSIFMRTKCPQEDSIVWEKSQVWHIFRVILWYGCSLYWILHSVLD